METNLATRRRFLGAGAALAASQFNQWRLFGSDHPSGFSSAGGLLDAAVTARSEWVPAGTSFGRFSTYSGRLPGPVLEARPGDTVRLAFTNQLLEPTNLHFHGLHIPPTGNADNVFLEVPAGAVASYEFRLPESHPAGMFWYHPHLHGTVAAQVSRGLAGVILIRGELDQIPEVAAAAEHILVLQDFALNRNGEVREPSMMERMNGREGPLVTVTGAVNPTLGIEAGGLARLRILNASPSRFYRLRLDGHAMFMIGTDGGSLPAPRALEEILLVPGERVDVLVRGEHAGGDFRLMDLPYNRGGIRMGMGGGMASGASAPPAVLATLRYQGHTETSLDLPQALVPVEPLPAPTLPPRRFILSESAVPGRGMSFLVNGKVFDHNRVDARVRVGAVEDWEIVNLGTMDHPFHVHTNPFQVLDESGAPERAWKDVVLVPAGQRRRVRTRFEDFTGKTVFHCHILDHEDLGMMGTLELSEE